MTPAHKKKLEKASLDEINHYIDAGLLHHDAIRRAIKSFEKGLETRTKTSIEYKEYAYAIAFMKKLLIKKTKTMATKKPAAKKKSVTAKKLCSSIIVKDGLKKDGTLKKGFKYVKGGKIVKVKTK